MVSIPDVPPQVNWQNGMVLEPIHFRSTDRRTSQLAHFAGLLADPWPWGFASLHVDETSLAAGELRIHSQGVFPDGEPFPLIPLAKELPDGQDGLTANYHVVRNPDTNVLTLASSDELDGNAPSETTMPAARLVFRGGAWSNMPDWSPPALLVHADHPMRHEVNRQLGALAALGAGFVATLRLPGAENRPAARTLGQVAVALNQGVGVIEALLSAPAVTPGRIGIEALRLALGVRSAAGIFEPISSPWSPADQSGSIRRLLYEAESAASGIGLPFRAAVFQPSEDDSGMLLVDAIPGALLMAIEASRPADLIAARSWFDGAALSVPDRIAEALTRRVSGCARRPVDRDPMLGISSGPLLALYQVDDDTAWRGNDNRLALAAETPPPSNTSFSILIAEGADEPSGAASAASGGARNEAPAESSAPIVPPWARNPGVGGRP